MKIFRKENDYRDLSSAGVFSWGLLLITLGIGLHPACPLCSAGDWPHLRGPGYDAISSDSELADGWPAEGPPVVWIRDIGRGYSGFVVAEGRVYTQGQTLTGQYVYCLDPATGETLWECRYGDAYGVAGMYPGPRATPTYSDGYLYFAGPRGVVGCVDARDGSLRWKRNIVDDFGSPEYGFGYSCTPVVELGRVVLPAGGPDASVVALATDDGSTVWATGSEPPSYCGVVPITLDNRHCGVVYLENALTVFDWKDGQLLCEHRLGGGYNEHAALPLYREPYVVLMSPFRAGAQMFRLRLEKTEDGDGEPDRVVAASVWNIRHLSNDVASSVLLGDAIFGFDIRDVQAKPHRPSRGHFRCLDFMSGEVRWESERPGHSTVVVADDKLVLFNDSGELILARAMAERYEELARTAVFLGETCWTAPAIHNDRLYLRTPTRAACVHLGKPTALSDDERVTMIPTSEIKQSRRINLNVLLGGEREFLWDPPDVNEHTRCFVASLAAALVPAWVVAAALFCLLRWLGPAQASRAARVAFWVAACVMGIVVTPVLNRSFDEFYFTWPLSLSVGLLALVTTIMWAEKHENRRLARWATRGLGIAFLIAVALYFAACGRLGLPLHWVFITGLIPGALIALPAAAVIARSKPWIVITPIMTALYFAGYYWCSALLLYLRITYF